MYVIWEQAQRLREGKVSEPGSHLHPQAESDGAGIGTHVFITPGFMFLQSTSCDAFTDDVSGENQQEGS